MGEIIVEIPKAKVALVKRLIEALGGTMVKTEKQNRKTNKKQVK